MRQPDDEALPGQASREELLRRLAARFDDPGAGDLDWDALRDGKRSAWPIPACRDDAHDPAKPAHPASKRISVPHRGDES